MRFAEPEEAGGNRCYPKDVLNHLLLVWACDYVAHSPTQFTRPDKPSDVIIVDVVDLDQVDENTGQPGSLAIKAWWRQARLIQSLKPRLGNPDPMLVRMTKGLGSKGMNAPFELVSQTADPAAVARATAWYSQNPHFTPSRPSERFEEQAEPVAQVGFGQPDPNYQAREETALERMARLSVNQASPSVGGNLPPRQPQRDDPPPF